MEFALSQGKGSYKLSPNFKSSRKSNLTKAWSGLSAREYSVVVPILNPTMAEGLVRLAIALSGVNTPIGEEEKHHVRIVVLGIVTVPGDKPLSEGSSLVKAYRKMLGFIPPDSFSSSSRVEIRTEVRVAREVWQGIADQMREEEADLLLLHWKGSTQTPGKVYGDTIDALLEDPPGDIVLARFNSLPEIKSILLPVRGGSYSSLSMRLVSNLAEQWNTRVTVMHNVSSGVPPRSPAATGAENSEAPGYESYSPYEPDSYPSFGGYLGGASLRNEELNTLQDIIAELPPGARLLTTQGTLEKSLKAEGALHDLVVLGASSTLRAGEVPAGKGLPVVDPRKPLLVVKTRKPFRLAPFNSHGGPEEEIRETVDRWFAQNTFNYREFRSLEGLTFSKGNHNLRISLVIPVYGQVHPLTLAKNVHRVRAALMRDLALFDEIIISAGGSRLDPREIDLIRDRAGQVEDQGNQVIFLEPDAFDEANEANPRDPDSGPGKALWEALQVCRGDLVVWADPHHAEFDARFFYGLLGPLLSYPEFQVSVGFFSQPGKENPEISSPVLNDLVESSVRPLLGGLFPSLAGVIDPLLLIGAARREHLERLPISTSAAFTPALLLDTTLRAGLMSVAQVDLGAPTKREQSVPPAQIISDLLEVVLRRAGDRGQSILANFYNPSIKKVQKEGEVYSLKVEHSPPTPREIPPLIYSPGYQRHTF